MEDASICWRIQRLNGHSFFDRCECARIRRDGYSQFLTKPKMDRFDVGTYCRVGRTNDIDGGSSFADHSYFTFDGNCKLFVCEDPPARFANSTHPTKSDFLLLLVLLIEPSKRLTHRFRTRGSRQSAHFPVIAWPSRNHELPPGHPGPSRSTRPSGYRPSAIPLRH